MKTDICSRELSWKALKEFEEVGFYVMGALVSDSTCDALAGELSERFEEKQTQAMSKTGGVRNLLRTSGKVKEVATEAELISILTFLAGSPVFPVRALFFDKADGANWSVPWHQDLAINVSERIDTPGFTGWSVKDGEIHVHPPVSTLEAMITMRLQLDDCSEEDGVLRVLDGSHRHGKLDADGISRCAGSHTVSICDVPRCGALFMRPLLLHSSLRAQNPKHRRVLHLEYATLELPNGLQWANR